MNLRRASFFILRMAARRSSPGLKSQGADSFSVPSSRLVAVKNGCIGSFRQMEGKERAGYATARPSQVRTVGLLLHSHGPTAQGTGHLTESLARVFFGQPQLRVER